jgi:hypothetical protein
VVAPQGDEKGRQLGESMENRTTEGKQPAESDEEKEEVGKEQWQQARQEQKIRDIAGDDDEEATKGRRGTLEDARGVLHHGPTGSGDMKVDGDGNVEAKRLKVDRADTASLD